MKLRIVLNNWRLANSKIKFRSYHVPYARGDGIRKFYELRDITDGRKYSMFLSLLSYKLKRSGLGDPIYLSSDSCMKIWAMAIFVWCTDRVWFKIVARKAGSKALLRYTQMYSGSDQVRSTSAQVKAAVTPWRWTKRGEHGRLEQLVDVPHRWC